MALYREKAFGVSNVVVAAADIGKLTRQSQ